MRDRKADSWPTSTGLSAKCETVVSAAARAADLRSAVMSGLDTDHGLCIARTVMRPPDDKDALHRSYVTCM